jgi:hypothetical protein
LRRHARDHGEIRNWRIAVVPPERSHRIQDRLVDAPGRRSQNIESVNDVVKERSKVALSVDWPLAFRAA